MSRKKREPVDQILDIFDRIEDRQEAARVFTELNRVLTRLNLFRPDDAPSAKSGRNAGRKLRAAEQVPAKALARMSETERKEHLEDATV